ncbi:Uncharacterised protein [Mycobacterium tuberculosis]|uniref:Uncharacterized protein n=1 Tax=Mycobacterium tuberculosis TaxID=1773 RepID=A0A654U189_MYCTX|nr:Uncharacterised protein [Mycobacterium tuberculosis]
MLARGTAGEDHRQRILAPLVRVPGEAGCIQGMLGFPCNSGYVDRDHWYRVQRLGNGGRCHLAPWCDESRCGVGDLTESFDGCDRKIAVGHDGDRPELCTRQHRQVRLGSIVGNDQHPRTPANRLGTQIRGKATNFGDEFTVPQCASAVAATQGDCFRLLPCLLEDPVQHGRWQLRHSLKLLSSHWITEC